jgi:enoyl-CoA hydratase/carnithine racemase
VIYDLPEELRVEVDGPVRTVVINRPGQLNAVNAPLHRALAEVWRQLSADRDARAVVLTGAGRAFSAGGDLTWITSFLSDPVARYDRRPARTGRAGDQAGPQHAPRPGVERPAPGGVRPELVTMESEEHRRRLLALRREDR